MCPLVTAKFARAQSMLGTAPIRLVLLTLDPGFDTPRVLRRYGRRFGQNVRLWTLATGSVGAVAELAGRFGIATMLTRPGSVIHTEGLTIVAPDGQLARTIYGNAWSVTNLVDAARATLPHSPDPALVVRAWLASAIERCGSGAPALRGSVLLGVFALAIVAFGAIFWRIFARWIRDATAPS